MKKLRILSILCLSLVGVVFFLCKIGSSGGNAGNITALRIESNEISQWEEVKYEPFKNKEELFDIINGGADEYFNRGAIEGFRQTLSKGNYEAQCLIIFYGTSQKAGDMYNYTKENVVSSKETAGNFNENIAVLDNASIDGYSAYASFGAYYIELVFSNYGSNKAEAKEHALRFLEVLQSKINSL